MYSLVSIRRLLQKQFFKRLLLISSGTFIAKVVVAAATPLLTRLYTPEDFGTFSLFLCFFAPLASIGALKYESAIILPKRQSEAKQLVTISLLTTVCVSLGLLSLSFFLLPKVLVLFAGGPKIRPYLWLMSIGVLGSGVYVTLYQWMLRANHLRIISITYVAQAFSMLGIQLLWTLFSDGPIGLIYGYLALHISGGLLLAIRTTNQFPNLFERESLNSLKKTMRAFAHFPLFTAPGSFINAVSLQLPLIGMAYLFNTSVVGKVAVTIQLLSIPQTVIGLSAKNLFSRDFAEKIHGAPKELWPSFWRFSQWLLLIATLVVTAGALAPNYLPPILGSSWQETGQFAQILAFPLAAQIVFGTTTNLNTLHLNRWQTLWDILRFLLIVLVFWIADQLTWNVMETLWAYSITLSFLYAFLFLLNVVAIKNYKSSCVNQHDKSPDSTSSSGENIL